MFLIHFRVLHPPTGGQIDKELTEGGYGKEKGQKIKDAKWENSKYRCGSII